MSHCLFISDLHLCDSRPHITTAFIDFLDRTAAKAQALYILGDLFEYWAGDDAIEVGAQRESIEALRALSKHIPVFFMAGNRDFLIGTGFAKATGITILPDPSLITLYGKPVLLSHGDALCTDDADYQAFRAEVRNEAWQKQFLSQPLEARIDFIEQLRAKSEREKSTKSMRIMDVNIRAVEDLLSQYDYPPLFIHGHTHRPNTHIYQLAGHTCERRVLGDWYEQGSYLLLNADGCYSHRL
ncbi:MAG TPA: UDP-2,3-diacylglucosamine diphosphatase [Methylotenera sp.]|nr:UDP-2,3-diacylglucosamine diphosphatase [Methylotenera sp.]